MQPRFHLILFLIITIVVLMAVLYPHTLPFKSDSMGTKTNQSLFLPTVLQPRLYGVLGPQPQHASSDWQAGMRVRTLELGWDYYEPQDNVWDTAYVATRKAEYQQMLATGYKVVLDVGLQYPPDWMRAIRPWEDQYGNFNDAQVNAVWSPVVRQQIQTYIQRVFQDFGTDFYAIRLGSGGWIETLYPDNAPGFSYSYWAFDSDAMQSNPVPNWRPGQPSPNGEALTFYTWYLNALIDTMNWQQDVVRHYFKGYLFQILTGQGLRPQQWTPLINANLIPEGLAIYSAERGAVWDRVIDGMRDRTNVVIYSSTIADSSAVAPSLDDASPDPFFWSSTHWIAFNADRYGMLKWGENPGRQSRIDMRIAFQQVQAFDLSGLLWAHEEDLYDGRYATIDDYSRLIAQE